MKNQSLKVLVLLSSSVVCAQEFRATISGSVTDQQGAAIPKVSVVATEIRTGAKSTAVSEEAGNYTIDHTAILYLLSPDRRVLAAIPEIEPPDAIVAQVLTAYQEHRRLEKPQLTSGKT